MTDLSRQIPRNYDANAIPWHRPFLEHPARFKAAVIHRRGFKTSVAAAELVRRAYLTGRNVLYLAPFLQQARRSVFDNPKMLQNFLPESDWLNRNSTEMKIPLGVDPKTGSPKSYIYIGGADNPDAYRSGDFAFVVFDESQMIDLNIWPNIFLPILTASKGTAWFLGTYEGKDSFYDKVQYALTGNDPDWFGMDVNVRNSGIFTVSQIREMEKQMPRQVFEKEMMNKPLSSGSAVFREPRRLVAEPELAFDSGHAFRMGVDLAKRTDWTVISLMDCSVRKPTLIAQRRFNHIEWSVQTAMIEAEYLKANRPEGFVDSTGVGDPIFENLEKTCSNLKGYRFTGPSREALISNLVLLMENGGIALPPDDGLIAELESFRWVANRTDASPTDTRVRFRAEAPSGMTDDRVMSLALACWELPDYRLPCIDAETEPEEKRNPHSPFVKC